MHADHPLLGAVLYLMCDDLRSTMQSLKSKKVPCTEVLDAEWGITTTVKHPTAIALPL